MRIAQIAPPWLAIPPKGYGGIEWVVALLADGLVERGHDVTLFATGDSNTKARLDFVFEKAPGPSLINDIWHESLHTVHALRDPQAHDVLHVHTPYSALAAGIATGVPVVHTLHGSFTDEMRRLYGEVSDRAWFVAISEAQKAQMPDLRYGGVVYNGVDVPAYPFRTEKEDYLLFIGRATEEKGAHRAVLAAREAGISLICAVKIANEDERRYWENDVLPILPPGAKVLGEVTLEDKMDLLSRARAVLFPIDWDEPFGLVMTEAMACGTPVLATPRGSVPEVVADGETGFILPVEDYPQRAAEALGRLRDVDPAACRARVEDLFSKERMVEGYERVFDMALADSGG